MPYSPSLIAPVILFSSLILPMGQKGQKYNSTTWSLTIVLRQFAIRSLTTKHWPLVTQSLRSLIKPLVNLDRNLFSKHWSPISHST